MTRRIGVLGGSGLYGLEALARAEEVVVPTPFGAPSDAFLLGELSGVPVAFLARHGRGHRHLPSELNFRANVWAFRKRGCSYLISSSACGSMKESYRPTDIVLPDQFVDRTAGRASTFFGGGCAAHVSMARPVSSHLLDVLGGAGREAGATVHAGGTYLCIDGPHFSSRAESLLYRSWGVDVIGMTNATEAKLCREAEVDYASLCLVTDYDCWHEAEAPVTVEAVLGTLRANADTASRVLAAAVARLDPERPPDCSGALRWAVVTRPDAIPEETRARLALFLEKEPTP